MFITNNYTSFHLWRKEYLVKYQKASKYYVHDRSSEIVGKTSKNCHFGAQFALKWGQYGSQLKQTIFFFAERTAADHKLSKTFYFIKI